MFSSISPQILVALASALIAAVVTLLSVYLTNINNRKNEEAKYARSQEFEREIFKRQKLEELYLLFSKWDTDLVAIGYFYIRAMNGAMSEEDALVSGSKNQISEKDYLQRITMMIDLYFSELKNDFDTVLDSREKVASFCGKPIPQGARVENLIDAMEDFRETSRDFKQSMVGLTNAL
ncbi:hypothetical protein [Methylophaga sp.]|uniref:hypothetical protein n=1 Tax=Methylophaga sp. TaxID=2024840 RepID=UPI003A946C93